jgi:integrase
LDNLRDALRPLKALCGDTLARDFDSACLEAIQAELVRGGGLCRTTINARVNRIRRAFRWAVRKRLVPVEVIQSIATVPGLQWGRTTAPEPEEVLPVAVEHVEATLPCMPRPVGAMVRLQLLTACRAGEVMVVRGIDLNTSGLVWTYRPHKHKNQHRGQQRVIYLGPQAQEVIKPFLKTDLQAYLFSPRDWVEELHAGRAAARKTKPTPSELKRRQRRQRRQARRHAARYDRRGYRQAVVRACDKADALALKKLAEELARAGKTPEEIEQELEGKRLVPRWSPLQLRHSAATAIRARYGVEAAKVILGHTKVETTQIYAERDLGKAQEIMAEIG